MNIVLSNPRGFCAGVDRAIDIVDRALELFGAPVFVRHEVVHNRYVVECLREKGVVFVEDIDEVPDGAIVIFSAHGVAQSVRAEADRRKLRVFDATCPLVTKVHMEVQRYNRDGYECVLIGHAGHPEVEGTLGQWEAKDGRRMYLVESPDDVAVLEVGSPDKLAFITQTTLSMDDTAQVITALRDRFPNITGPKKDDICYATQNRQDAVKTMVAECDLVLVVGSRNSSNSNRLHEIAKSMGVESHLIDNASELDREWLVGKEHIGVTAGASAPEILVQEVIDQLHDWQVGEVIEMVGREEKVVFTLPKELQ